MYEKVREFIIVNIGLALVACGIYFFLIPNNLAAGGVSGLAMVINGWYKNLSIGFLMVSMNAILFVIGFIFIGNSFGFKTVYSSFALSFMMWILEKTIPMSGSITGEMFLELIYGILISGAGMGIVFLQNASTGGTDIIAKILNKYFKVKIGRAVLFADFLITLLASVAFGLKIGLYALLGVIINGFVIDSVIEGIESHKEIRIISSKNEQIMEFIINELQRGATIYTAKGGYSGECKESISTVVDRKQFLKLRNYIRSVDRTAFVTVYTVHETLGNGFCEI